MKYQIVLEMPEGFDITAQSEEVLAAVGELEPFWPDAGIDPAGGHMMPGSRIHGGKKLVIAFIDLDSEDPFAMIESLIALYELPWAVVAMSELEDNGDDTVVDVVPDASLIDYLADKYTGYDPVVVSRPTAPIALAQFVGKYQIVVPAK